jgi:hypothetical protein
LFTRATVIMAQIGNTVAIAILAPAHEARSRIMMSVAIPVSVCEVRPAITIPVAIPLGLMNGSAHGLTEIPKPRGSCRRFACVCRRSCGFGNLIPHLSARTMAVTAHMGVLSPPRH